MTTSEEIEGWRGGLDALHARIAGRFHRSGVTTHCLSWSLVDQERIVYVSADING
jgi:hypothetical protein